MTRSKSRYRSTERPRHKKSPAIAGLKSKKVNEADDLFGSGVSLVVSQNVYKRSDIQKVQKAVFVAICFFEVSVRC